MTKRFSWDIAKLIRKVLCKYGVGQCFKKTSFIELFI